MIDKSLQDGYQNLLKENTRLHAEKKHIVDSAATHIKLAEDQIAKLHKIIDGLLGDAIEIVRSRIPDSPERTLAEIDIANLAPLKIGANGQEQVKK